MSTQTQHTVIIQIFQPQRISNNTELYPFEFMPYLSNRAFTPGSGTALDGEALLPIIKQVGGIRADCSDLMIRSTPVQITIDNRPGTFGPDRKFTDELDRFTLIGQNMNIYICGDEPGSFSNASDLDGLLVVTKIQSIRVDTKQETVIIAGEQYKTITQPLNAKPLSTLADIKESAISTQLPFIFGYDVYTKLIPLNNDMIGTTSTEALYGFCTDRSISPCQAPSTFYIRDPADNTYKTFIPVSNAGTAAITKSGVGATTDLDITTDQEFIDYIKHGSESFSSRVITSCYVYARGQAAYTGTLNGAITIEIYKRSKEFPYDSAGTRPDKTPIARAVAEKTDYALLTSNTNLYIYFQFDKPIYVSGAVGEELYYSISHDDDDDTNTFRIQRQAGTSANRWRRKTGKNWRKQSSSTLTIPTAWYGMECNLVTTSITTDENGNRPRYIQIEVAGDPFNDQYFQAQNLDIVVQTDGVTDDASGTVTGSASAILNTTQEALRLLHFTYYPSTAGWDSTFQLSWNNAIAPASTDTYYRSPSFAVAGGANADQVIREICRQYYTAIVPIYGNFDNVGSFIEGKYKTGYTLIVDNEIISSKYEYKDSQNIVNSIEMSYEPDLLGIQADDVIQRGGTKAFRYYLQQRDTESTSIDIFGIKPLKNTSFPYLNYTTFAEALADLFIAKWSLPAEYFEIEVPFEKFYDEVQHFRQIRVFSPRFPSYFGASVAPTMPSYAGEEGGITSVDEARGQYIRGVVEAIEFLVDANKPATVRYTCKRIRDNDPFYEV